MPSEIRNTVKAVICDAGRLLAIRCRDGDVRYYTLPGGQQHPGEMLTQTLERECREEIGCDVHVGDILLITERPDYGLGHMVDHYFVCRLREGSVPTPGSHLDFRQEGIEWLPAADIERYHLHPLPLRRVIAGLESRRQVYCGLGS